jgi:hypothetical protein
MPAVTSPAGASRTPLRPSGWPARRTPRWIWLAAVPLIAVALAVSLVHHPSRAERASDLRGYLQELTTDTESCAAGVSESLTALRLVQAGHNSPADVADAISVARQGAANCGPAENEQIDDLENYQAPESLDGFGLVPVVTGLVNWVAPDAVDVQSDVANLLAATTPRARAEAQDALSRAITVLNAQRAAVNAPIGKAITALRLRAAPLRLPG